MNKLALIIGEALVDQLPGFKLIKSRSSLIKEFSDGWQAIAIDVLTTASPGVFKFSSHAQIHLESVENIYAHHHPYIKSKIARQHPTITINCDSLLIDKTLANGIAGDESSLKKFATDYAADAKLSIMPWLEKYSNESILFEGLTDSNPRNWVTSDRLVRYPVLMAFLAKQKEWNAFDKIANEFIEYCNQRHSMVHKPVAEAMLHLKRDFD